MTRETIIEKLKQIFSLVLKRTADPELITDTARIREDFGISSVGMIYLVIAIEESFGITMDDVSTDTFQTLGDVIGFIEQNL